MTRVSGHLYAIESLSPIVGDTSGASLVYSCLPLDLDKDGSISKDTRYITLLSLPDRFIGPFTMMII